MFLNLSKILSSSFFISVIYSFFVPSSLGLSILICVYFFSSFC
jgi:hypothetical protein